MDSKCCDKKKTEEYKGHSCEGVIIKGIFFRIGTIENLTFVQTPEGVSFVDTCGRVFQTEEIAIAKSLRQGFVWSIQETGSKTVWA